MFGGAAQCLAEAAEVRRLKSGISRASLLDQTSLVGAQVEQQTGQFMKVALVVPKHGGQSGELFADGYDLLGDRGLG